MNSKPLAITFALVALVSVLTLPWPISIITIAIAGFFFPPSALALGIIADILYYPGHALPSGIMYGVGITLLMVFVRHFVKTRIM